MSTQPFDTLTPVIGSWVRLKNRTGRVGSQTDDDKVYVSFTDGAALWVPIAEVAVIPSVACCRRCGLPLKDCRSPISHSHGTANSIWPGKVGTVPVGVSAAGETITLQSATVRPDVMEPRLGLAKSREAVPYLGLRPDPSKNYVGGKRTRRKRGGPASGSRYWEGGHSDTSRFSDTHERVADPTAGYLLDEEKQTELLQRDEPEPEGDLHFRGFEGPSGFTSGGEEYVQPEITAEDLARAWGLHRVSANGHTKPITLRALQQRTSKLQRRKLAAFKLYRSGLSWDAVAKQMGESRATVREWSQEFMQLLGMHLVRHGRQQNRNAKGQLVGRVPDTEK